MLEMLEACEQAVRLGGAVLLKMQKSIHAREKAPRDLVTEADLASQNAIQACLATAYPDFQFLGEESTGEENTANSSDYCWVVDHSTAPPTTCTDWIITACRLRL